MLCDQFAAELCDCILRVCKLLLRVLALHGDKPTADFDIRHIIFAQRIHRRDRTRYGDIKAVAQLRP